MPDGQRNSACKGSSTRQKSPAASKQRETPTPTHTHPHSHYFLYLSAFRLLLWGLMAVGIWRALHWRVATSVSGARGDKSSAQKIHSNLQGVSWTAIIAIIWSQLFIRLNGSFQCWWEGKVVQDYGPRLQGMRDSTRGQWSMALAWRWCGRRDGADSWTY